MDIVLVHDMGGCGYIYTVWKRALFLCLNCQFDLDALCYHLKRMVHPISLLYNRSHGSFYHHHLCDQSIMSIQLDVLTCHGYDSPSRTKSHLYPSIHLCSMHVRRRVLPKSMYVPLEQIVVPFNGPVLGLKSYLVIGIKRKGSSKIKGICS